jgi:hypothetical protein
MTRPISEAIICWNPCDSTVAIDRRGALALLPWPEGQEAARGFRCMAGATDPQAHDARASRRQAYVAQIASRIWEDGLQRAAVFAAMIRVSEFQTALTEQIEAENLRRRVSR